MLVLKFKRLIWAAETIRQSGLFNPELLVNFKGFRITEHLKFVTVTLNMSDYVIIFICNQRLLAALA